MSMELAVAIIVFLASAAAVWVFGTRLATYGDVLASLTGLGRLFVGSILVALATSVPQSPSKKTESQYITRGPAITTKL